MNKFLLIGIGMLLGALLTAVAVWFILQDTFFSEQATETNVSETVDISTTAPATSVPAEGTTVTLTPEQRAMAESFGVDPDNFVITPGMIECAREKVGDARVAAYQAGEKPTVTESLKLIGCLNR